MDKGIAAITGGASGIGNATAQRLAADGYRIAIIDINEQACNAAAAAIPGARAYPCDVSDEQAIDAVAARIEAEMGPVTALVTAAGLLPNSEALMDMDVAAHDRMWEVNYKGTILTCRAFARAMIERKGGAIVTIGSINSRLPMPLPAYNPGKAAVERVTELFSVELGRHGIRVNSVGPTYVMTPPLRERVEQGKRDLNKIMSVHSLSYLPEPADIANAIAFLMSDQARAITGVLLPVDSGFCSAVSYRTYAGGVPWQE